MSGRLPAPALLVAATGGGLAVVLAATVATGLTESVDQQVRDLFFDPRGWGEAQLRAITLTHWFGPQTLLAVSIGAALVLTLVRRNPWPLLFAGVVSLCASLSVIAAKGLMGRVDTPSTVLHFVGSYPSGHMVASIVFTGQVVLLLRFRPRWLPWLGVVGLAGAMAWAIQFAAVHWITDVVGGVGVAVFWLAWASTWRLRTLAIEGHPQSRRTVGAETRDARPITSEPG